MNKQNPIKQKELKTLQIGANQLAQRFTLWSWTKTPHSHISTPPCQAGLILIIILTMMIRMSMMMTMVMLIMSRIIIMRRWMIWWPWRGTYYDEAYVCLLR